VLASMAVGDRDARADEPVAALPPGVKAVWSPEKAVREVTPTRECVSINGLWRWQPAAQGATQPPSDGWGHFKVPGPWPGIVNYMQHAAQPISPHPAWKVTGLAGVTSAWYRRDITIPNGWKGRRIVLCADYVNSLAAAFVDGRPAGELRFPGG